MPSRLARNAPHFLLLAGGLLLLGVGTASVSTLEPPVVLAAEPVTGTSPRLCPPSEPDVVAQEPVGDTTGVDATPVSGRENPLAPHPGATDQTITWVAPSGSTGPGVSAIFLVFGHSSGLTWALRVAYCENHYDPAAVNSGIGATGLFQFMPSTWSGYFAGADIWDPLSQARAALDIYNRGWTYQWECK